MFVLERDIAYDSNQPAELGTAWQLEVVQNNLLGHAWLVIHTAGRGWKYVVIDHDELLFIYT